MFIAKYFGSIFPNFHNCGKFGHTTSTTLLSVGDQILLQLFIFLMNQNNVLVKMEVVVPVNVKSTSDKKSYKIQF